MIRNETSYFTHKLFTCQGYPILKEMTYMYIQYWTLVNWKINRHRTVKETQPFYNVSLLIITLCIVRSLVRRRVTRRIIRLQTMYNVFKCCKKWWNNDKNQFTVTGVQLHRNRKYFHFNNASDCRNETSDFTHIKLFTCQGYPSINEMTYMYITSKQV